MRVRSCEGSKLLSLMRSLHVGVYSLLVCVHEDHQVLACNAAEKAKLFAWAELLLVTSQLERMHG